jgi:hypothetical protein
MRTFHVFCQSPSRESIQCAVFQRYWLLILKVRFSSQHCCGRHKIVFFFLISTVGKFHDRVLMGKPGGRIPLERPRHGWEDNIKMDFREVGWGID